MIFSTDMSSLFQQGLPENRPRSLKTVALVATLVALVCLAPACRQIENKLAVVPRTLRDVPADRLAFRFEADTAEPPSATLKNGDPNAKLATIQADFDTNRKDDALVRTVVSPDGQRALALYATPDTPEGEFRLDLYTADGKFLRNVFPQDLSGAFPPVASWSPDGQQVAFIGRKVPARQPTTTAPPDVTSPGAADTTAPLPSPPAPEEAGASPAASASVAPLIPSVPVFNTEQIYLCDRDGFNLRPLTTRDGLIYFNLAWAPDAHALSALACKEDEWDARANENRSPAGRPRLITLDGRERLLDDRLTEALPVWSPDSSKVATGFDTDVAIYDAATNAPTAAGIPLREPLLAASASYDAEKLRKKNAVALNASGKNKASEAPPTETSGTPISFNPVISLDWPQPETLYFQTGFVRIYRNGETVSSYLRWHALHLSPQAVLLNR